MKLHALCLGLALLLCASGHRAYGAEKIKTSAEKVTVFIDGAQVTRTKQIDLSAGESTLVFTGLSPYLDENSMQVTARGKLTILGIARKYTYTDSLELSGRRKQLASEQAEIDRKSRELTLDKESVLSEMELLKINCSAGARTANVPLTTVRELTEYYATRIRALKKQSISLDEQQTALAARKQLIELELTQAGQKLERPMSQIEVYLSAEAPCRSLFTLVYYVRNAGWYPCYDIRSAGLQAPAALSYKANIYQNTREEWENVALTLSSANPRSGNIAPELRPYWLDYGLSAPRYDLRQQGNEVSGTVSDANSRNPIAGVAVFVPGTTIGTSTDVQGRYSITLPDNSNKLQFTYIGMQTEVLRVTGNTLDVAMRPNTHMEDDVIMVGYQTRSKAPRTGSSASNATVLEFAEFDEAASEVIDVEQTQGRAGYEFDIRQPYTVASNGLPVSVEIGRYELPTTYTYRSVPRVDKDAFLVAEATGWAQYNLLEGEANVYFEDTFVGKTVLNPGISGDTLRFAMGRDRSILIRRDREYDYNARKVIGSNRTQTVGWLLDVRNTRKEPVTLTLCDQMPVSRNSEIVVTQESLSGGNLDPASGIVTWELTLKPGEQRQLRLRYRVKYAKERHLPIE